MKKVFIKVLILVLLVFGVFLATKRLNADTSDVYLIMTNPSSDCSTEMNIVWHAKIKGTIVEYTTKDDTEFSNKKIAVPVEEELEIYDGTSGGDVKDYKCEVTLKHLTPDTDYIYRVGLSDKSKVYHFKTAGSKNFSFVALSDIHTYSKLSSRLSKANTIIHSMENDKNISFVLAVGDLMAYGTNRGYWDDFTKCDFADNYMIAATPGNHDYYNSSANFLDGSYFNAYTNNPDNGCTASFNTTYYFYYGDVLFISLNSEDACTNASARESQRVWFEKVLQENEKAIYKVVYFHRSMYPGSGSNTGHANTMKGAFQDLIDKYGVDLVFGGHDHVYVRTKKIVNGSESTDTAFGTVYISLPQIGDRASAANNDMTGIAKKIGSFSGAVLVSVDEERMSFALYDDSGAILDSGSVMNKMNSIEKNKISNGTKISYDGKFSNMTLTIPELLYQRAYNIKVIDKSNNKEVLDFKPSYAKTEYKIFGISDYIKQKDFEVNIQYRDGTSFSKSITVKNNINYGKIENIRIEGNTLFWTGNLDDEIVEKVVVKDNNKEFIYTLNDSSHQIESSIHGVKTITLQLIAYDGAVVDEFNLSYGINIEDVTFAIPTITTSVNEKIDIEIVNSANLDIPFSYVFDEEFIEMINGVLYAKKKGSTTITCHNEYYGELIVSVTINEPKKYVVTYNYNGGDIICSSESVSSYSELTVMQMDKQPVKEGYTFSGWFIDESLTTPLDINETLNKDITLYAKWQENAKEIDAKKAGCNKATIFNMLMSLSLSFGLMFVLKKKH